MVVDPASSSLGAFFRYEVLPRLTAEGVYNDPAHHWQKGRDKWRGACPWHTSQSGSSFSVPLDGLL